EKGKETVPQHSRAREELRRTVSEQSLRRTVPEQSLRRTLLLHNKVLRHW
ncbi:hypothetical protein FRX31_006996, partial [Thalictrum thalictroides]